MFTLPTVCITELNRVASELKSISNSGTYTAWTSRFCRATPSSGIQLISSRSLRYDTAVAAVSQPQ